MSFVTLVGRHEARSRAAQTLQRLLPRLVALSLNLKHAQWNLTGPSAPSIRAVMAEIDIAVTGWADDVAELTVALGHPVDARPSVAAAASAPFRPGRVTGCDAIEQLADDLHSTGQTIRRELSALGDAHAFTSEILASVLEGLQRWSWELRAYGD
jgi:DNA-binding ferritin-like protein